MPVTVNGIGTTYGWSSSRSRHFGTCEFCDQDGMLKSYDTWHCLCFIFIPIIPFQKLRIINECPHCQQHRRMKAKDWRQLVDSTLAPLLEQHQQNPNLETTGALIDGMISLGLISEAQKAIQDFTAIYGDVAELKYYHGLMSSIAGKWEESENYLRQAIAQDPDQAKYHASLSDVYWESARGQEAAAAISQACELAPDNFDYRKLQAWRCYLMKDYQQALQAFQSAIQLNSEYAQPEIVKQAIDVCQQKLENPEADVDPYRSFQLTKSKPEGMGVGAKLAIGLGIVGLIAVIYTVVSLFQASGRTLYIFNDLPIKATVNIGASHSLTVPASGRTKIHLDEALYPVVVVDAQNRKIETNSIDLTTGFWERPWLSPIFVYNVGGFGIFLWEKREYSNRKGKVYSHDYLVGQQFMRYNQIDYKFQNYPETIYTKKSSEMKTRLSKIDVDPYRIAGFLLYKKRIDLALAILKQMVRFTPGDRRGFYVLYSMQKATGQQKAAVEFLQAQAGKDPSKVALHRFLQDIRYPEQEQQLLEFYQRLLQSHPQSAAACYLYGRLLKDDQEQDRYMQQALSRDKDFIWAQWSIARTEIEQEKYRAAAERLRDIVYRRDWRAGTPENVISDYALCLYANGNYRGVTDFIEQAAAAHHYDHDSMREYFVAAARLDKPNLKPMLAKLHSHYSKKQIKQLNLVHFWARGDFAKVEELLRQWQDPTEKLYWQCCLALARGQRIPDNLNKKSLARAPVSLRILLYALAPDKMNLTTKEVQSLLRVRKLEIGEAIFQYLSGKGDYKTLLAFKNQLPPRAKRYAFLACALAAERRNDKAMPQLLALAKKANIHPSFPYHFINYLCQKHGK